MVWIGCIWLKIWTSEHGNETSGSIKPRSFRLAEWKSASQGLSSLVRRYTQNYPCTAKHNGVQLPTQQAVQAQGLHIYSCGNSQHSKFLDSCLTDDFVSQWRWNHSRGYWASNAVKCSWMVNRWGSGRKLPWPI